MHPETAKHRDIVDAITSSSPERLKSLIDQGHDVNTPLFTDSIYSFNANSEDEPLKEEVVALDTSIADPVAYPLHLAIVSLYQSAVKAVGNYYSTDQAYETIRVLLRNGADWKLGCTGLSIINTCQYEWISFLEGAPRNQPIHLALFLKKYEYGKSNRYMDSAITLIESARKKEIEKIAKAKPTSLKTTAVLESVANTYKSMLFSEDFSDVTFQCSDGVSIPAHKIILAASSPYFKTAFHGDWTENNSEGVWRTSHSSSLIKSVLILMYTGSVEECQKLLMENENDPLGLLDLACEYDIKPLVLVSVDNCIKNLKLDNVRMMLQTANVHSCEELKKACFEYIKANAIKALMSADMIGLATEDPDLWAELGTFLNGKRPRADG
ncbi:BTB/POZ domain-containing protein [Skeletonema marinoi]|uniref:BTB/POZ domain-containing protein n=1 Tax=Skeletonema marinoi TaxID=267567 RepID=A0AAD9D916_9STRA|nr:BTB/POZ domain-containing protein [Skeletonema marinoi]